MEESSSSPGNLEPFVGSGGLEALFYLSRSQGRKWFYLPSLSNQVSFSLNNVMKLFG